MPNIQFNNLITSRKVRKSPVRVSSAAAAALLFLLFVSSCSLQKFALTKTADMLSGDMGTEVFSGDDDLDLVGDALPFALKLYETMLSQVPNHQGLLLTTGMGFISYANVFIQTPALMLPEYRYEEKEELNRRAKAMYIRGRNYLLKALELRYPGFGDRLRNQAPETALADMTAEDVPYLYWAGTGWFAAIGVNVLDIGLTVEAKHAISLVDKAYKLEPDFGGGLIHEFYISYYASVPEGIIEGSEDLAVAHFERAVELSGGTNPMPYVSLATTLAVKNQDYPRFKELLGKALAVDPEANPKNKLACAVTQKKAAWYMEHAEDYFLEGDF